uniref:Uncharacterized protein n=1 Tax=Anguilla anguilla TaxID=7936 RepID=A0A0E9VJZ8_ANGAN
MYSARVYTGLNNTSIFIYHKSYIGTVTLGA